MGAVTMNIQARPTITAEEQARRRKNVDKANWSARMEGLPDPLPGRIALDELWITGQISSEEKTARVHAMMKARDKFG
jgi:hypothetical protein